MKTTIIDIAKKLGVHPSTVSLALNNSSKISAATRRKIQKAAEEMGYRKNPYVSALMSARRQGKTPQSPPVIAFITSSGTPDGWKEMHNAIEFHEGCADVAHSLGMRIEEFWLGDANLGAKRLDEILYHRGIQGGIFLPTGEFREKMNHSWEHIACVSYGIYDIVPSMDRVKADHYGNMEKVLGLLAEKGFGRIGFAMDTAYPYKNHNRWLAAYLMHQQNQPRGRKMQPWVCPDPTYESFVQWLEKEKPDVIACMFSAKVKGWLERCGLGVPGDIGLATLGTASESPSASGIIEDAATCGKLALEMLIERIHHNQPGSPAFPRYITVRGRWNPGKTI